ncbi:MAG: isochorismate synthase [Candidatus Longimicrobiales bacterium M2_2A_002]
MTDAGAVDRKPGAPTRAIERFLVRALESPLDVDIRQVTIPAPATDPEALLDGDGPGFLWTTPAGPVHAGLGAAAAVSGAGHDRFARVRAEADRLWSRIDRVDHPDIDAIPPRLFGGFSFLPGVAPPRWRPFGDATFLLPRLHYTSDGDQARLAVAVRAAELTESGPAKIVAEARSVLERLAGPSPAGSEETTSPRGSPARERHPTVGRGDVAGGSGPEARAGWDRSVASIQRRIADGRAAKIVAARHRSVPLEAVDVVAVLRRLARESDTAARFAFRWGGSVFLGATPERLVTRSGFEVRTEALAGSVPAGSPGLEARLLESLKDEAEHGYVVQAIVDALAPLCAELDHPAEPRVQRLRHVLHLQTPFVGRLRRGVHVLELVERLHPTPAVGGLPTAEALEWIETEEPGSRGWYAAPVGWFDAAGDGEFGVALRSGLIHDGGIDLFAGAGIVRDSDPTAEFEETEVKLRTMLDALGVLA